MTQNLIAAYVFLGPFVFMYAYVQLVRTFSAVHVTELLIMVICAIIPLLNIVILLALVIQVCDFGDIFNKVVFKQKEDK